MKWDDIFTTGEITGEETEQELCGTALMGWAMCTVGKKPPENFGKGLVAIGKELGFPATEESIVQYAKEKGWLG